MTVLNIPVAINVTGTVAAGESMCYNATGTLTVAGGATTFTVENGGSATMIAGQNIIYLPGTTVQEGGYMHGYISDTYCGMKATTIVTTPTGADELPLTSLSASFVLYPNPTNGNFTLVQKGDKILENVRIEVYSMHGEKVMTGNMIGEKQHDFLSSDLKTGLYFVKIVAGDYVETIKLIKL
jgi:hypothetical protein